jgi:indolepyruvate ferredoxin oxidoreductase beta subunit
METRTYNILFCGVGGQGVLKAAEICGLAALRAGYHVRKAEVHGMSQRGGSVESHLRFGAEVFAPLIPAGQADFVVCFDRIEGGKFPDALKPGGVHFNRYLPLLRKHGIDPRFENTFFLGVLSRFLPLAREVWLAALAQGFVRAQEENRRIFVLGAETDLGDGT